MKPIKYDLLSANRNPISRVTICYCTKDTKKVYVQNMTGNAFPVRMLNRLGKKYERFAPMDLQLRFTSKFDMEFILKEDNFEDWLDIVNQSIEHWNGGENYSLA